MVSSIPSEKLKEIFEKNGDTILLDPGRCEGLLKDHCGAHRREISAIVGALEERVPMELRSSWQSAMTPEAMRARMVQRLEENRGLAPEVAGWAVDAWSYALGVGLERKSDRIDDKNFASVVVGAVPAAAAAAAQPVGLRGDRVSTRGEKTGALASLPATFAEMKPKKKAGIGAIAALAIAGAVIAMTHHPTPPPPGPAPQPNVVTPTPAPASTPAPKPHAASAPAPAIAAGTPVSISLNQDINSEELNVGDTIAGTVISPLTLRGNVVVPRGASAVMRVTEVDNSGKYAGRSRVDVTLMELSTAGHHYRVSTTIHPFQGPSQQAHTAERAGISAAIGGVAGFIGGKIMHHAKAGTLIGAGTGATIGAVTNKPMPVKEKAETIVQFRLSRALNVGANS